MQDNILEFENEDEGYISSYIEPEEINLNLGTNLESAIRQQEFNSNIENYFNILRQKSEMFPYVTDDSMCSIPENYTNNPFAIDNFLFDTKLSKEITIYSHDNYIDDAFTQEKFLHFRYELVIDIVMDYYEVDDVPYDDEEEEAEFFLDYETYKLRETNFQEYIISKEDINDRFSLLILLGDKLNLRVNYTLCNDESDYTKPLNYDRWKNVKI